MDASSVGSPPLRARQVAWFVVQDYPPATHSDGAANRRSYGNPRAYVVGLVCLPLAFALAALDPFCWPRLVYGALIFVSGLPGASMVMSWAEDAKFSAYSRRGVAAQLWLYAGGALPQAVRAIKKQRSPESDSSQ